MLLVTDDNAAALSAIADDVEDCETGTAVVALLPNEVGALEYAATRLGGAGVQVNLVYATSTGGEAMVVLNTSDDEKAVSVL